MLRRLLHALAASLLLTLASLPARADMTIEIVGGGANRHVIALPAFAAAEAGVNGGITPIVRNDLQRSGAFNALAPAWWPMRPAALAKSTTRPGAARAP